MFNAHYKGPPFPRTRQNIHDKAVCLIDFENTHYGWIAHDWAGMFRRLANFNFRRELLEIYLKHVAELEGRAASGVTRADVEKFKRQIEEIENATLLYKHGDQKSSYFQESKNILYEPETL